MSGPIGEGEGEGSGPGGCNGGQVSIDPAIVDFGGTWAVGEELTMDLTITNNGDSCMKITEIRFQSGSSEEFSCEGCKAENPDSFPVELASGDSYKVTITFQPVTGDQQSATLIVVTTDPEFPSMDVPVSAGKKGRALLSTDPALELDFGFVPQGSSKTLPIVLSNVGDGNAALKVIKVDIQKNDGDFEGIPIDPLPVPLSPGDVTNVDVTYHPQFGEEDENFLVITTEGADSGTSVSIKLIGRASTTPRFKIDRTDIDFGAIVVRTENQVPLTITNEGGEILTVAMELNPLSDPFFLFNPTSIGNVPPGASFEFFAIYRPSDPLKIGEHHGIVTLATNDPNNSTVELTLKGEALDEDFNDGLKIEMKFDNNAQGLSTGDLRYVSLAYVSEKYGFCDAADPKPDWQELGRPRWSKLGTDANPQFVFHAAGIDDDQIAGEALFDVFITYDEDCKSIPIDILSQVLNIAPDLLLSYLTQGLLPPGIIDLDLGNMCLSRSSSDASITAFVNGGVVDVAGVSLGRKGDDSFVFLVHRSAGKFTVTRP